MSSDAFTSTRVTMLRYFGVLAVLALVLPKRADALGRPEVLVAIGLLLGVGVLLAAGERRPGHRAVAYGGILVFLAAVALLRHGGGASAGYGPLVLLPVIWAALRCRSAELVLAIAGGAAVFFVPLLAIGEPQYPAAGWRSGSLTTAVAIVVGVSASELVRRLRSAQDRNETILSTMAEGFALSSAGRILAVNPALCAMTGFREDQLVGASLPYPFLPFDEDVERRRRALTEGGGGEAEVMLTRADGSTFPAAVTMSPTTLGDGSRAFLTSILDITARRANEDAARTHAEELQAIADVTRLVGRSRGDEVRELICSLAAERLDASAVALWEVDGHGVLRVTGWAGERRDLVPVAVAATVAEAGVPRFAEADGLHLEPIGAAGDVRGVLAVAWDVPTVAIPPHRATLLAVLADEAALAFERGELLARLAELSRTDDLTGLPNRRAWDDLLARELRSARRSGRALAVAMLDLDRFKDFNDQFGHLAGDRLLRLAAATWERRLRETDVLARWGGEEFALLLPGCDSAGAHELVERLRGHLPDGVTFSAGVMAWDGRSSAAELVGGADAALYAAKVGGRDRVVAG